MFKQDKISTLEASVDYVRSLLKERDKLTTSLGCELRILFSRNRHGKGAERVFHANCR